MTSLSKTNYETLKSYLNDGIVQTEILNTKSTFMICSYWWGNGVINRNSVRGLTYDQQVDRLIAQCRKLKINYYFIRFPIFEQKGMYQIALGLKGEFIMRCLLQFPKYKVIYIDTDLQILKYPNLFDIDADCYFLNWNEYDFGCYNPYQLELPGGILGFANTHGARTLLSILNSYMIKNLHLAEDKSFSGIITRHFMGTYLRCVWLPLNYMYMFGKHKYDPTIGKYTHIADFKEELKNEDYALRDLVMIHEDFETGALDDVFFQRVGKVSRWPPNVYRQLGEKLRCLNVTFNNYVDFNLNKNQLKDYLQDFKIRETEGVYKNKKLITDISSNIHCKLNAQNLNNTSNYILVSLFDNTIDKKTMVSFKEYCDSFKINYLLYKSNKRDYTKVSKPTLFLHVLKQYKKNIVFVDITTELKQDPTFFKVKNMDFMTINLNNTRVTKSKCSDLRILKTLNDNLYFFAYNDVVLDFLKIWYEYNDNLKFQHKNLEYAFNKSLSTNRLRCYWFPKEYILGPVLKYTQIKYFFNHNYPNKNMRKFTKSIQLCGIKPPLQDGLPRRAHYYGSSHGSIYHNKYGKLFLEF